VTGPVAWAVCSWAFLIAPRNLPTVSPDRRECQVEDMNPCQLRSGPWLAWFEDPQRTTATLVTGRRGFDHVAATYTATRVNLTFVKTRSHLWTYWRLTGLRPEFARVTTLFGGPVHECVRRSHGAGARAVGAPLAE